ncbi:hypothetical protein SELMODRAFT_266637 [Selaginella moellendorffii]|uniref:Uncharacterized protein n=2 Tax=Selaginella moellendorffii TaxID=88036 RepID=D8QSU9_SELML|nr:hypothetical protein SELMODRAFT_266637 [Selaginella moellendorffii]
MAIEKVVLITGCAEGGIGACYSRVFHSRGFKVYATDVQPVESMQSLRALGIQTLQLDVTSDESVRAAVDLILRNEGRIDVLVNNAGLSTIGPLAELPLKNIERAFQVNVFGTLRMIQAVVPSMAEQRQGRIINVGSVVGYVPTPWAGSYCASKASVHALSDVLRVELAPLGIQVVLIVPGSVKSQLGAAASSSLRSSEWKLYKDFSSAIAERATSSQSGKATATEEFAVRAVGAILEKNPPRHFVYGFMSGLFLVLRWSPLWLRDLFMRWRFGLLEKKKH